MSAGSPVPADRLADALWDDDRPQHRRRAVQTYLTRLRSALGADLITTEPAGYRLHVHPDQVDALRFTRLLDRAAVATGEATRRGHLEAALALWRGNPFDQAPSEWLEGLRERLVERYLGAVEQYVDLILGAGRAGEAIVLLHPLTASHPLRESLWVRLLAALASSGRQAEALTLYESIRRRLADELGAPPGAELQQVHADLLAAKPARRTSEVRAPATMAAAVVPRQLPADISGFIGRTAELKALHSLVDGRDRSPNAVVISAIGGMAGIGKTSLAVHWAHEASDRFPDGQLYLDLHGFHPSGQATAPAEAVGRFLDALGVPPSRVPADLDSRVGLYRSLLAHRRILVLLDNARDADQVRPLLPGSSTCTVVVTSRNRLTGLVAAEAAHPLVLDLLTDEEARDLLAARLGRRPMATEPEAIDAIIARCTGLPLALAVAAARTATHSLSLAAVAAQLDDELSTLDALDSADAEANARVVFSWSYRTLSPAAARLFRLLGLHRAADITATAAASLAGVPRAQARRLLAELAGAHLLGEHFPGRYAVHDLLRAYAAELTRAHDDEAVRHAALHRLLDHYLHTAYAAAVLFNPHRHRITIGPARPGVAPDDLDDHEQAYAWFTAEHRTLLTAVDHAAGTGFDTHAWQLAWTLAEFLHRHGHWHEWRQMQYTGLAAARRRADLGGQAVAHRGLAMVCSNLGLHEEAEPHFSHALRLYGQLGDKLGQAYTHVSLSAFLGRQDRHAEALHHCQQALELHVAMNDRLGEANVLNAMGFAYARTGDYGQALAHCERAADLQRQTNDSHGLAHTLDSLGFAHLRLGSPREAVHCYLRAAALFQELGSRFFHAETLVNLGDAHVAADEPGTARRVWQQALDLLDEAGHPRADEVRAKLDATA